MANAQTEHYGLNQWSPEDPVLREEFNRDNAQVDEGLTCIAETVSTLPRLATGSYVGTGTNEMTLHVGFRPRAAIIRRADISHSYNEVLTMVEDMAVFMSAETAGLKLISNDTYFILAVTDTGFTLLCTGGGYEHQYPIPACNSEGARYIWFALG